MGMRLASAAADSAELSVVLDRRQQAPANEGQLLIKKLQEQRDKSTAVRGVFDDRKSRLPRSALGLNILGTTDDLVRVARRGPVEEVIVALPQRAGERLKSLFWKLEGIATDLGLSIEPVAETFQVRGIT
jgi:polysaccharide biosynthesis protein PslA